MEYSFRNFNCCFVCWFALQSLVNKLVPCAWLSSGALEVWRLRLRLRLYLFLAPLPTLPSVFLSIRFRLSHSPPPPLFHPPRFLSPLVSKVIGTMSLWCHTTGNADYCVFSY